jgi:hypothetical protein
MLAVITQEQHNPTGADHSILFFKILKPDKVTQPM